MRPVSLVVHRLSIPYVRGVLEAMLDTLRATIDPSAEMIPCDGVDDLPMAPGSLVVVVGENLPRFRRQPGCVYVLVNFSVVRLLGNPFAVTIGGLRLIRAKARLLNAKIDLADAVLDFYPAQTRRLRGRVARPVLDFIPWVRPRPQGALLPLEQRAYDVCFVGGLSPRRQRIIDTLRAAGLSLSPHSGIDLEDAAAQSRVTLNLHMQRSNHLEIPRIVGALASGSMLVTEDSHGLADIMPGHLVESARYSRIADTLLRLFADRTTLARRADRSSAWYRDVYVPKAQETFRSSLEHLLPL